LLVVPSSVHAFTTTSTLRQSKSLLQFGLVNRHFSTTTSRYFSSISSRTPWATKKAVSMTLQDDEDPYLYLEEVESERSLEFAKDANQKCLATLGDPTSSQTYANVLKILTSDDRIPHVSHYGYSDHDGDSILMNLWKDSKNTKGLWRRTSMKSYQQQNVEWTTVLDLDKLAASSEISWVWKGCTRLPRSLTGERRTSRVLLKLSNGGSDAVHVKEFDLTTNEFVTEKENAFILPEAKTSVSYKSRNVLLVGSDFGPGSLTDSGYPRVIKEWVRGTSIKDAPVVFEGESTDVSVSTGINDQRFRGGPIYELRSRSLTCYTRKRWVRKVQYEHLLAPHEASTSSIDKPQDFIELNVPLDASVSYMGNTMLIFLRSDWEPKSGSVYKTGTLLYVDANTFLEQGKEECNYHVLFEPTAKIALSDYSFTKNYIILFIMDCVKSKPLFYKLNVENGTFTLACEDTSDAEIRACSASAIDPYEGNDFWFYSSGYTQPSTLSLGDVTQLDSTKKDSFIVQKLKSLPDMYKSSDFTVTQKFATSKDGTEIPYFLITKKDIVLDGNTPTLLYAYGGFEVSLGPKYIATVGTAWLERGGAYVEANIRGGGEFGPSWHQAGLKANRNKCFEDFIAVGEHLVNSVQICKPSTLAIRGGSNGGLLVGMMYVMRPDLFGAIHCAVPLLDMKRFHKLLAGASWMAEYGNPDEDWDDFLHKYSPYHLIDKNEEKYPPILITTSTRDDRVHPGHSRKMVQKLWDLNKDWPVYYYENIEGGHGGAADSKQSAFMTALAFDFMWETLCKGKSS